MVKSPPMGSIPRWGRSSGEGNGTPLQYSCLENPMGGGAWWAAVYGVAQSRTRLKQLSNGSSLESVMGFPGVSVVKSPPMGSVPRWGRSSGEGNCTPLQYSCLENPIIGGAW